METRTSSRLPLSGLPPKVIGLISWRLATWDPDWIRLQDAPSIESSTYSLRHAFFRSLVHLFMSSSLDVFVETIGCVKGRIRLSCDGVGFVESNSGCLVEALRREKGRGETGFFLSFIRNITSVSRDQPNADGARSSDLNASEKSMTYKDLYWRWSWGSQIQTPYSSWGLLLWFQIVREVRESGYGEAPNLLNIKSSLLKMRYIFG